MKMPRCDFKPPQSLTESLQRFTLELNCMTVWLRNEARYHDAMDQTILDTALLISDKLDDSHREAEKLIPEIDRRVEGVDRT